MTPDKKPTSQARISANRRNAAKSTGPKTEAGKAKSRLNALTHGLRAEQVVLPGEDAAAFSAERDAFFEQWKPADPTQASFVERLAAGSWRLRRCIRVEAARYSTLVRDAARAFDGAAKDRLEGDLRLFYSDPRKGVERLMAYRPGVEQLFRHWDAIAEALSEPGAWNAPDLHHEALCRLRFQDPGMRPSALDELAEASWCLIVTNNPGADAPAPWSDPDGPPLEAYNESQAERVRQILLEAAEKRLGMLQAHHAELPDLAPIRARVIDAQCVDGSREGAALMRYEGMHDRAFRANLNQLIKLKKLGPGLVEADDPTDFDEEPPAPPNEATAPDVDDVMQKAECRCIDQDVEESVPSGVGEPAEEEAAEAGAPIEATDGEANKADRDRGGRIWPVPATVGEPDGPRTPPSNR